ncbi:site-specific integrase [Burkholderia ubonensis]|uniref:site-specific integrase n=1 Tax=Burkholderia ubonensis TaxID=101571 RepID=UPI000F5691F7|nr:site-specific integrase [Burkholderia ubonensis]
MATITTLSTGVRAQVRKGKGGNKQSLSQMFDTEQEARTWAARIEKRIDAGEIVGKDDSADPFVARILERYGREVSSKKRGAYYEQTCIARVLRNFPQFNKRASKFSRDDVQNWIDERSKQVGAWCVIREATVIKSALYHALDVWKHKFKDELDPTYKLWLPTAPAHRTRRVPEADAKALLDYLGYQAGDTPANSKQRVAWGILFCIATSVRIGELLKITWADVHVGARYIQLHGTGTKNGKARPVLLSKVACALLALLPQGEPDDCILPIKYACFNQWFYQAKKAKGIKNLRFHDTRREAITLAAPKYANELELAQFSGHLRTDMLRVYYAPEPASLALKLD